MPSTNGHGPKRAILYARVSTDEQARNGYSLAQQLEALREYANREGYEILEEVADPGQSGASLERPGMDRVRDLVVAGGVSVVLAQYFEATTFACYWLDRSAVFLPRTPAEKRTREQPTGKRTSLTPSTKRSEVGGGGVAPATRASSTLPKVRPTNSPTATCAAAPPHRR